MPFFLRPGVFVIERDLSQIVPATATSIGGIVGAAKRGQIDRPFLVTTQQQFLDEFGRPELGNNLHDSALAFLREGNQLYVVRKVSGALFGGGMIVAEGESAALESIPFAVGDDDPSELGFEGQSESIGTGNGVTLIFGGPNNKLFVAPIKPNTAALSFTTSGGPDSIPDALSVNDEVLATGDGVQIDFYTVPLALVGKPVVPASVVIQYTIAAVLLTATINTLTGAITGTSIVAGVNSEINFTTGQVKIEFSAAPDLATNITADYTMVEGYGVFSDTKLANGVINYATGEVDVTFKTGNAPINASFVSVTYDSAAMFLFYQKDPGAWGNNLRIQITNVDRTNNVFDIVVSEVQPDGQEEVKETFTVSREETKRDGFGQNQYIETVINTGSRASRYIRVLDNTAYASTVMPRSSYHTQVVGTGTGVAAAFAAVLALTNGGEISPSTLQITGLDTAGETIFIYDDGLGNLTGAVDDTPVSEVSDTGDGVATVFAFTLSFPPAKPGTVTITDTVETFTDDGLGALNGDQGGTGLVDYVTGEVTALTFAVAPANLQAITSGYEVNQVDYASGAVSLRTLADVEVGEDLVAVYEDDAQLELELSGGSDGLPVTEGIINQGWDLFANPDEIDVNILINGGYATRNVHRKMIGLAEDRKDCFAILDMPFGLTPQQEIEFRKFTGNYNTNYAAIYGPWVKVYDDFNDVERFSPPSGWVGGVYAFTDATRDAWIAPAGLQRGILNVLEAEFRHTPGELDLVYYNGINPIRTWPGRGTVVWGQKTLQYVPSALDRVNVRRLLIVIEKAITRLLEAFVFEPNDPITRDIIVGAVDAFLKTVQNRRGITGRLVVSNDSNNPPEVVDRNELHVDIYIKPTRAAEHIVLGVTVTRTGASFEEIVEKLGGV